MDDMNPQCPGFGPVLANSAFESKVISLEWHRFLQIFELTRLYNKLYNSLAMIHAHLYTCTILRFYNLF